jgi:hypothetical protein
MEANLMTTMVTPTKTNLITAEELLQMGDIGRCELVQGELIKMSLPKMR